MKKVTAIFDVGKTNKKLFLLDEAYQELYREYTTFDPITDPDGYPAEDLGALVQWMQRALERLLAIPDYEITGINFSTYGASLVHLDANGQPMLPLYDYTKPMDAGLIATFYSKYGPESRFSAATGSLNSGMLNAGMQLYWLKYTHPEAFKKINYSLHLPQYLSFVFTQQAISEYTSIGCHTALWDYQKSDYHDWVFAEGLDHLLAPLDSAQSSVKTIFSGKTLRVGRGIHDSSAALLPYIRSAQQRFILVSTGTWSITLNPFSSAPLTAAEVAEGGLQYMQPNGQAVKASRLFLGNEYAFQIAFLAEKFKVPVEEHKKMAFDPKIYISLKKNFTSMFRWKNISSKQMPQATRLPHQDYATAYHQLVLELVELQAESICQVMGNQPLKYLYVEGGFTDNAVFIQMLAQRFPQMKLKTTNASIGSALGAAIALSTNPLPESFLKDNYALREHLPLPL